MPLQDASGSGPDLLQLAGGGVDDEAADGDGFRDQGVVHDRRDGFPDGSLGVMETFQPVLQVDAGMAERVERLVRDAFFVHQVMEMGKTHVAGAAGGMVHDHDLFHAEFVDRHDQAAERRIERGEDEAAGVLDDFRVAVFQAQRGGEHRAQAGVHAAEDRQLLGGELVRQIGFIAFRSHERLVERENVVYHIPVFLSLPAGKNFFRSGFPAKIPISFGKRKSVSSGRLRRPPRAQRKAGRSVFWDKFLEMGGIINIFTKI